MLIHEAVDLVNPRAALLHGQEHAVLPARRSNEHRLAQSNASRTFLTSVGL
jgi:hypothetical protein